MRASDVVGYHPLVVGDVALEGCSGQAAADGGLLVFSIRLRFRGNEGKGVVQLQNVTGLVQLETPPLWLGHVCPLNSVFACSGETPSDRGHISPTVFLSNAALRAIEQGRESLAPGVPMKISVKLRLHLDGPQHAYVSSTHLDARVTQSDWLALLGGMRWENRVAIEIPVERGDVGGAMELPATHMRRAIDLQRQGLWVQTVAECRKVLEATRDALQLQYQQYRAWQSREERESWEIAERIEHVRMAAHHLMHPCNHPGVSDDPDAEQARLAVGLAGLMLRYYAKRLA